MYKNYFPIGATLLLLSGSVTLAKEPDNSVFEKFMGINHINDNKNTISDVLIKLPNGTPIIKNSHYLNINSFNQYINKIYSDNNLKGKPSDLVKEISNTLENNKVTDNTASLIQTLGLSHFAQGNYSDYGYNCDEINNIFYSGYNQVISFTCSNNTLYDVNPISDMISEDIILEDSNIIVKPPEKKDDKDKANEKKDDTKDDKKDKKEGDKDKDKDKDLKDPTQDDSSDTNVVNIPMATPIIANSQDTFSKIRYIFYLYSGIYTPKICKSVTNFVSQVDEVGNTNIILSCDHGTNYLMMIYSNNMDNIMFIEKTHGQKDKRILECFKSAESCTEKND